MKPIEILLRPCDYGWEASYWDEQADGAPVQHLARGDTPVDALRALATGFDLDNRG